MPIFGGDIRMHAPLSITGIMKVKLRTGQVERQKNRIQWAEWSAPASCALVSSQQAVSMASATFNMTDEQCFYRTSALRRRRQCRVS